MSGLSMLDALGLEIIEPVPSLFSFNIGVPGQPAGIRDPGLSALMGTVVNDASTGISGTRFRASGPLLITDWGMSGPAILRLSSYAARYLAECQYNAMLNVNWLGHLDSEEAAALLSEFALGHDIIIFVSGSESSNGKVLCNLCRSLNIRTYHVSDENGIRPEWFRPDDRAGVCGATSTPKWLLEAVAARILALNSI